jgi:hypothetical protein
MSNPVLGRMAPRPTAREIEHGIPVFLDDLVQVLSSKLNRGPNLENDATRHGGDLLRGGFTVAQVVHDYGDVCQTITEMAIEQGASITTQEFQALNLCLDEAIAGAVTEFGRLRELRNLLGTATLATEASLPLARSHRGRRLSSHRAPHPSRAS